jgi:hypothetical protein
MGRHTLVVTLLLGPFAVLFPTALLAGASPTTCQIIHLTVLGGLSYPAHISVGWATYRVAFIWRLWHAALGPPRKCVVKGNILESLVNGWTLENRLMHTWSPCPLALAACSLISL